MLRLGCELSERPPWSARVFAVVAALPLSVRRRCAVCSLPRTGAPEPVSSFLSLSPRRPEVSESFLPPFLCRAVAAVRASRLLPSSLSTLAALVCFAAARHRAVSRVPQPLGARMHAENDGRAGRKTDAFDALRRDSIRRLDRSPSVRLGRSSPSLALCRRPWSRARACS